MREHTKGPWKYDDTWALIKGEHGEEIAAIHSGVTDCTQRLQRATAHANALLIAAAPDMYEALDALRNAGNNEELIAASTLADAALAKASGK